MNVTTPFTNAYSLTANALASAMAIWVIMVYSAVATALLFMPSLTANAFTVVVVFTVNGSA